MRERDIFDELIEIGKRRGVLTYDEINEALPSEFFSPDELEDLMDILQDMGVKVIDHEDAILPEEEVEEELEEYEKAEDLVQAYFYSMGDISILKKDEETELAKRLEEGKKIVKDIVTAMPLYKKTEVNLNGEVDELSPEEERAEVALTKTAEILENLMGEIENTDKKIVKYGSFKDLKKNINEKKKKNINVIKLLALAKEVEKVYKKVESEV